MSLNWSNVKSLAIPVGGVSRDVKRVSIGGAVVWEKPSPLPYDAEVEYLESTGTQYINTGIPAKVGLRVVTTFAVSSLSNYGTLFNVQYPNNNYLGVRLNGNTSNLQAIVRSGVLALGAITVGNYNTLDGTWSSTGATITLNGTTYTGTNGAVAGNTSYPIYIFAGNLQNAATYYISAKVAAFQMYDGDTLVRDCIPVRVGQVGELYDRFTGTFLERHGTFNYGPDVVPVEYIESHGTEYIDTGFIPDDTCGMLLDVQPLNKSDTVQAGCRSASNGRWWLNLANNLNVGWNTSTSLGANGLLRYKIGNNYLNSRKCSLNGTETAWSGYANVLNTTTHSAALFAANSIGTILLKASCKMWMAAFSRGSAVAMQFSPVRVGNDGAMMDVLTRRIYRNAGTGAFTYGADLPYPIGGN